MNDAPNVIPFPSIPIYCWCGMCGFNAILPPEHVAKVEGQAECPACASAGMFSFLSHGSLEDMEEDAVDQDDPMQTYNPETN